MSGKIASGDHQSCLKKFLVISTKFYGRRVAEPQTAIDLHSQSALPKTDKCQGVVFADWEDIHLAPYATNFGTLYIRPLVAARDHAMEMAGLELPLPEFEFVE